MVARHVLTGPIQLSRCGSRPLARGASALKWSGSWFCSRSVSRFERTPAGLSELVATAVDMLVDEKRLQAGGFNVYLA